MEIEIQESKMTNRFRILSKIVCIYMITVGLFIVIIELMLNNLFLALSGVLVTAIGFYNKKRIARITTIKDKSLVLLVEKRKIELNNEDILSISTWTQITLIKWFTIKISLKERKFGIVKSYIVGNEPNCNFLSEFSRLGIKLKNIPNN
jgi:hypothetical protein